MMFANQFTIAFFYLMTLFIHILYILSPNLYVLSIGLKTVEGRFIQEKSQQN